MVQDRTGTLPGRWRAFEEKFLVEERFMSVPARQKLYRTAVALMAAGALLFAVVLASVLEREGISAGDEPVRSWLLTLRSEPWTTVMIALAIIFGPVGLPVIILAVTVAWGIFARHAWRPVLLAAAMLTGVVLAQLVDRLVDRERPPADLMLFGADFTFSFPSGHVLGACDFLLVGAFLVFSRRRNPAAMVLGFAGAAMGVFFAAASRLYLGYHWLTDALASVSISLVLLGTVMAVDTWRTARIPGEQITGVLSEAGVRRN